MPKKGIGRRKIKDNNFYQIKFNNKKNKTKIHMHSKIK